MNMEFLDKVQRPGRYIGGEWNVTRKDISKQAVKFALCFPDLYEIGMSNLGLRIIYDLINRQEEMVCERCFAPAPDMQAVILENEGASLCSIESGLPLGKFDVIGFSVSGELQFSNVLTMLRLSGIPVFSRDRGGSFPLVIAGGQIGLNPEPLADFIDAFIIGEGEEVALEFLACYRDFMSSSPEGPREELLKRLAGVSGVYVPSLYELDYGPDGRISAVSPKYPGVPAVVEKRFVQDLNGCDLPGNWLVPYIQIVHDRVTVEVMRGCANNCRFCQARLQYYPYRLRSKEVISSMARRFLSSSGYEEFSLLGLSVGDYPDVNELIKSLSLEFCGSGVNLSLPSLKAKDVLKTVPEDLAKIRKTTLTFAPEAGSDRLRSLLRKNLNIDDLMDVAKSAYQAGYSHIKLYFMIGLPTETDADLDAIFDLSVKLAYLRKDICARPANVNLSINTFVPKTHTPFQWLAMAERQVIERKQDYLMKKFRNHRGLFKVSFHDVNTSILESALGRSGREAGKVIELAWRKGAGFDAWSEHFKFQLWEEAFRDCGYDIYERASRGFELEEVLPWGHINCGQDKEYLKKEFLECQAPSTGR